MASTFEQSTSMRLVCYESRAARCEYMQAFNVTSLLFLLVVVFHRVFVWFSNTL